MNIVTSQRGICLAMLALFCVGIAYSQNQGGDYVIGKGDQLLITVFGYNEFTTTQTVKDNGAITMPLIGDVEAAGLTKDEFIGFLRKRLAEYVQGEVRITVAVLASVGQRVTVLGAVTRPDNYPIANEMNLLELVSMAGGYLPDARLNRIKIFHKDKLIPPTDVDLESYIERSDIEGMPKVRAGDIVFIPRQQNFVKEFGEFFRDVAFLFTLFRLTDSIN
ncbi:MAG: polysaccharide export protein [Ignavibacteriae bacterium]|nr:polysaccharide export protein [Ignavibacteriota bacterium]